MSTHHTETLTLEPPIDRSLDPGAIRFLLLQSNPDGSATELLGEYGQKNGDWMTRSDNPDDFTDPIRRGNHLKVDIPIDADEWLELVTAPNAEISDSAIINMWDKIHDRNKADVALVKYLTQEPKRPRGMPIAEVEGHKPTAKERGPSINDFMIDIDKLERDRRTYHKPIVDRWGKAPDDPKWEKTYKLIREGSAEWDPNYEPETKLTVELMRRYVTERQNLQHVLPQFDRYLKKPRDPEDRDEARVQKKSNRNEKAQAWLTVKINNMIGSGKPWSMEEWVASANAETRKEIDEASAIGPDKIMRLLFRCVPNQYGKITDPITGEQLNEAETKIRERVIEILSHDLSSYAQALAAYEFTKRPPHDYYKFVQQFMDVMTLELGYSEERAMSAIIGMAYSHKVLGNVLKQSKFVHPIQREPVDPSNPQGRWQDKYVEVIKDGKNVYVDIQGNHVREADIQDIDGPAPYYILKKQYGEDGEIVEIHIPIKRRTVKELDASGVERPKYVVDASGNIREDLPLFDKDGNPEIDPNTGLQRLGRRVEKELIKAYKPVHIMNRIVIGPLKFKEWIIEVTRLNANQFAFEPSQMKDITDKIMQVGLILRKNYYDEGFHDTPGGIRLNKITGRAEKRRASGRKSQEYAEALTGAAFLWTAFEKLLRNGPAMGEGKDAIPPEEWLAMQERSAGVYDPRMYAAQGMTNIQLPTAAKLLRYYTSTLAPSAQEFASGDYSTLNQAFDS